MGNVGQKRLAKPRWWAAGLLGLVCLGLGQIYLGHPRRAITLLVAVLSSVTLAVVFLGAGPAVFYLLLAAIWLSAPAAAIWASISALRKSRAERPTTRFWLYPSY